MVSSCDELMTFDLGLMARTRAIKLTLKLLYDTLAFVLITGSQQGCEKSK